MLLIDHYVARSLIHGLGVFSAENVSKGMLVWEFNKVIDHEIPESKLCELPPHVVNNIHRHAWFHPETQCFWLGADGDYFMNHSELPALELAGKSFIASRDIFVGDELTCDYRFVSVLDYNRQIGRTANAEMAV